MGDNNNNNNNAAVAILADMRHVQCDCTLEIGDGTDSFTTVTAHRAILARATYFAALFEHSDPDRVDSRDGEGKRVLRAVYRINVPFGAHVVRFIIECLYDPQRVDRCSDDGVDPVDAVGAVLFLGAPAHYIDTLVVTTIRALVEAIVDENEQPTDHQGGRQSGQDNTDKEGDARSRLARFVKHVVDGDVTPATKTHILACTSHVLPIVERDALADRYPRLMPPTVYRPEARVGDLHVDKECHCWRTLHVAFDRMGLTPASASTITWQGLVFNAHCYHADRVTCVYVWCAPRGEALGAWPFRKSRPDGFVESEPRAAKYRVCTYHPVSGIRTDKVQTSVSTMRADGRSRREQGEKYRALRGREPPPGAILVPHCLCPPMGPKPGGARVGASHYLCEYAHQPEVSRDLLACEVEILVEELSPPPQRSPTVEQTRVE